MASYKIITLHKITTHYNPSALNNQGTLFGKMMIHIITTKAIQHDFPLVIFSLTVKYTIY